MSRNAWVHQEHSSLQSGFTVRVSRIIELQQNSNIMLFTHDGNHNYHYHQINRLWVSRITEWHLNSNILLFSTLASSIRNTTIRLLWYEWAELHLNSNIMIMLFTHYKSDHIQIAEILETIAESLNIGPRKNREESLTITKAYWWILWLSWDFQKCSFKINHSPSLNICAKNWLKRKQ